ncbi:MAG: type II toxin-antitoxin system HipA family toxin YjjJ [Polyangiaceae bacterium]
MAIRFDPLELERRLFAELSLVQSASPPDLRRALGISQPTFSRLVQHLGPRLLVVGRARATRYAARRNVAELGGQLPVYEIDARARASRVAILHAVLPDGFYVESSSADVDSAFHKDLPYWLHELRPSGFLGRLIQKQHLELELPSDVRNWSTDQTLRYLANYGWNLSGNLIVGDAAFQRYVSLAQQPQNVVPAGTRRRRYPVLSANVLGGGAPGSSAGGEQPKFLATKVPPGSAVLVKFSPLRSSALGRRISDLLVAEHSALKILSEHGKSASNSELVEAPEQTFLEVERFDRTASGGRSGVLSLMALDAQFVGRMLSWTDSVDRLIERAVLPRSLATEVAWLELFGHLIANTDMHGGNLSFVMRGSRVTGLAPVYDMLPAQYAGQHGHLGSVVFRPPSPTPAMVGIWDPASKAALAFWLRLGDHASISAGFRRIASQNAKRVAEFRTAARLLPEAR